jgi:predicted Zn-dependent peptidase/outer membrane protein OmpA-like peptidoglycan-associated protein
MGLAGRLVLIVILFCRLVIAGQVHGQEVVLKTLPNGLQCAYRPDTTRLLSHVSVTLRGGPLLDLPDADGLSNLWGQLLAWRSDSLPGDGRISKSVEKNGLVFRHATLSEGNFFSMSALPPDLKNAMALLATAIRYPGYDSAGLASARKSVVSEIQALEGQPEYFHDQALRERLWGRQQHLKNIKGSYIQLAALQLNWIRDYISVYLHPTQVLLAGTGRMEPEAFFALADSLLGDWKWGTVGPDIPIPSFPSITRPVYFVTENAFASTPVLTMAWPVPGGNTLQESPGPGDQLRLFAAMANLKQGRFYQSLVGRHLAREVAWTCEPGLAPGQMGLRVVPEPDSLLACLQAVRDALREMGRGGYFSKADVRSAERILLMRDARRDDHSLDRLAEMGQSWVRGDLQSGRQDPLRAKMSVLEKLTGNPIGLGFSPDKPCVIGLMHNLGIDMEAALEVIFGAAVATVEEGGPDAPADTIPPDSVISLKRLAGYKIYFESASFQPDGPSLLALDTVAEMLQTYPELKLYVNGFADGWGDGVANYKLSIERARSVRAVLSGAHQIDENRLLLRPFGEAFPEWPDDTAEHRALNRRVTFNIAPPDAVENVF